MQNEKIRSFPEMVKDAVIVGAVSAALALPLVGFKTVDRTTQIELEFRFGEMFYAVAVIAIGRLLLSLTAAGKARAVLFITAPLSILGLLEYAFELVPMEWPELAGLTWLAATIIAIRAWVFTRRDKAADDAVARATAGLPVAAVVTLFSRFGKFLGPAAAAFAILMPFLPFADQRMVDIGILILTYIMLGWGLNVVVGLAGLLDLGYVAFYAVGAYAYALLSLEVGLNFWEALPLAGACAATFGILLGFPVLRLRGDYLAIVTLGFGEMIRLVLLNGPDFGLLANGAKGIGDIPRPSFFGMEFTAAPKPGAVAFSDYFGLDFSPIQRVIYLYYIILLLAFITNWFTLRIRKLPIGRAWEALREDEIACRALGINPRNTKLTAFAIGAMFAGFAGSFFATRQGFISPESFNFMESAVILAIVVLGGMGSQVGVVLAAIVLIGGPEWFRDLAAFRMLAFGGLMVAVMVWRPQGLLAHREPTIKLARSPRETPVAVSVREKAT
ncbi:MAG TPA: high-affinity branched-chain amino acid ABC transporter permease LivM [Stellaceae bacterium]|jgi:branched-chain amino acid transport system permease protein|nr:high-affinity branched-chain amino acid ABC transporter permease LivM [Stellaceae bacterium]